MNNDRTIFYVLLTSLLLYGFVALLQHRGNTIGEIVDAWPLCLRVLLAGALALHLAFPRATLRFVVDRSK